MRRFIWVWDIGAVIRDHLEVVVASCARRIEGSFSPYIAECLALQEGLLIAKNLGVQMEAVETDIVRLVHETQNPLSISDDSPLIADIVNLQTEGIFSSCAYVRANDLAHLQATSVFSLSLNSTFVDYCPVFIFIIVVTDLSP
ncbi:hypothetical protein TIFTF001_012737 [Ficus carica]|uniref:RNase H type-1 domain-containing protein n=1 Tax=Ficus carica TaxID=3494 RepID=A0AA88D265_FICCA|nr:hypothetical protein TIFTF001_012737 [Ficus carica]